MSLSVQLEENYRRQKDTESRRKKEAEKAIRQISPETITQKEIKLLRKIPHYLCRKLIVSKDKVFVLDLPSPPRSTVVRYHYIQVDDLVLQFRPDQVQAGVSSIKWELVSLARSHLDAMIFLTSYPVFGRMTVSNLSATVGKVRNEPKEVGFVSTSLFACDILQFIKDKTSQPA